MGLSKWVVVFSFCSFLKHLSFLEHLSACTDVIKHTLSVLRGSRAEWKGCTSVFQGNARNEGTDPAMALSSPGASPPTGCPHSCSGISWPLFSVLLLSSRNTHVFYHAKSCLMGFLGFSTRGRDWKLQILLDVKCIAVSNKLSVMALKKPSLHLENTFLGLCILSAVESKKH